MDNAAEFHSRALRLGCAQYGIELDYRPVGRPHFGGHIERMNRTLMQRLKGLPGATGNSPKGRKARKPEDKACLTLMEFERWLALEVGQRYHHSEHRGLCGATPYATWTTLVQTAPTRQLAAGPQEALKLLINFMPMASRTIQSEGLTWPGLAARSESYAAAARHRRAWKHPWPWRARSALPWLPAKSG